MGEQIAQGHGKCATHKLYLLTCRQYDELVAEANNKCQICRIPAAETPAGKLFIDHDWEFGKWAVRGLLCVQCNNRLGRDTIFRPEVEDYLRDAWYVAALAKKGLVPEIPDEPPVGTRVRDTWGMCWTHRRGGRWDPGTAGSGGLFPRSWLDLCRDRGGAHRLTLLKMGDPVVRLELHVADAEALAKALRAEVEPDVLSRLAALLSNADDQAQAVREFDSASLDQ